MKKEIELYKWYFGVIIIAMIVATAVEEKDSMAVPLQTAKIITKETIVDWSNVDNPKKKEYLEHLYNTNYGQEETKKN
jgi:hypothetical protein